MSGKTFYDSFDENDATSQSVRAALKKVIDTMSYDARKALSGPEPPPDTLYAILRHAIQRARIRGENYIELRNVTKQMRKDAAKMEREAVEALATEPVLITDLVQGAMHYDFNVRPKHMVPFKGYPYVIVVRVHVNHSMLDGAVPHLTYKVAVFAHDNPNVDTNEPLFELESNDRFDSSHLYIKTILEEREAMGMSRFFKDFISVMARFMTSKTVIDAVHDKITRHASWPSVRDHPRMATDLDVVTNPDKIKRLLNRVQVQLEYTLWPAF